ncbi:MAG: hypothetical protein ACRDQB_16185 [Thermocrispum sp.]
MDTKVVDNPDGSRFELLADDERAGFAEYHRHGDRVHPHRDRPEVRR